MRGTKLKKQEVTAKIWTSFSTLKKKEEEKQAV